VGKCCKLDQVDHFSEILTVCEGLDVARLLGEPVQHDKTKHVEVDRHSIKENIEDNSIELLFVKSEDQLVDIFTKVVTGKTFTPVLNELSIGDSTSHLEGEC